MMKKSKLLIVFSAAVFIGLIGCGSDIDTGIALENASGHTLGWVNIVPSGSGWDGAEDLLNGELADGETEVFGVGAGTYDIRWGQTGSEMLDGSRSGIAVIQGRITHTTAINN